ncbi:MAG: hypothetical protein Q8N08_04220 [Methanobacteriaceae archaeon]|nr:hypothetical protein [Methanobacteriaceae archaeon]
MRVKDYYQQILELADLEIEATSIADSRRILREIEEREEILRDIHLSIKRDIRYLEADFMKRKRELHLTYLEKKDSSVRRFIGRGNSRVKAMKKLEDEKEETLGSYHELKSMSEELLIEMEKAKKPLQDFVLNRLGL